MHQNSLEAIAPFFPACRSKRLLVAPRHELISQTHPIAQWQRDAGLGIDRWLDDARNPIARDRHTRDCDIGITLILERHLRPLGDHMIARPRQALREMTPIIATHWTPIVMCAGRGDMPTRLDKRRAPDPQ